jgi:Protein of unknown function (DUF2878)
MDRWTNFAGYQLVWFAAVIGASGGWTWPALLFTGIFAPWQLGVSQQRSSDLRLCGIALLAGVVLDGALRACGIVHYAAGSPGLPGGGAPLWILALWVAFALTFNHSLQRLVGRPLLCAALGAAGGPLAYAAAARLGAVSFSAPAWHALGWLAIGWAIACVLLGSLAKSWRDTAWTAGSVPS